MFFFLPDDDANSMLSLLDRDLTVAPTRPDNRCIIWINLLASQETFAANDAAFRFAAYRPDLIPASEHPWKLLFEMLSRLEAKVENLEKKLINS